MQAKPKAFSRELYDLVRKNINPRFRGMVDDIKNGIEAKRPYDRVSEIVLPHGRGAGATSAVLLSLLYAVEKDYEERHLQYVREDNPKWVAKQKRDFKKFYPRPEQNRDVKGDVAIVCQTQNELRTIMSQLRWAIMKLGLSENYAFRHHLGFEHLPSGAKIRVFVCRPGNMFRGWGTKYLFIPDVDRLENPDVYYALLQSALLRFAHEVNTFCISDFSAPLEYDHWVYSLFRKPVECRWFHRYFATFKTVPRAWLGEGFYRSATYVQEGSPEAFRVEFLGKRPKRPKRQKIVSAALSKDKKPKETI